MSTKSQEKERMQFQRKRRAKKKKKVLNGRKRWDTMITNPNTEGIVDLKRALGRSQGGITF